MPLPVFSRALLGLRILDLRPLSFIKYKTENPRENSDSFPSNDESPPNMPLGGLTNVS
jgi:hypothetical protein